MTDIPFPFDPKKDGELHEFFHLVEPDSTSEDLVFIGIGQDSDEHDEPLIVGIVDEDYFIARGAPTRTAWHYDSIIAGRRCYCNFCHWFRANLVID